MKLTRRSLFPLSAAGILVAPDGSQGERLDPALPGFTVRITRSYAGWVALTLDREVMESTNWHIGQMVPVKWVPLQEWLDQLDQAFKPEV